MVEVTLLGSPPLARERLRQLLHGLFLLRITPARAGKTSEHFRGAEHRGDHPRSRGKDMATSWYLCSLSGSPPLARERRLLRRDRIRDAGITPARAGKTIRVDRKVSLRWDHPRSRGKDPSTPCAICVVIGSPPLARERPDCEAAFMAADRITPARAGKTLEEALHVTNCGDHPRSRGKDQSRGSMKPVRRGSPPLARERRSRRL